MSKTVVNIISSRRRAHAPRTAACRDSIYVNHNDCCHGRRAGVFVGKMRTKDVFRWFCLWALFSKVKTNLIKKITRGLSLTKKKYFCYRPTPAIFLSTYLNTPMLKSPQQNLGSVKIKAMNKLKCSLKFMTLKSNTLFTCFLVCNIDVGLLVKITSYLWRAVRMST